MFDPVAFGEKMGSMMREAVAPLHKKIKSLEAQIEGVKNQEALIEDAVSKQIAALGTPKDGRDGVDGKDADMRAIEAQIRELVAKAVADIPAPKDGKDGVDGKAGADGKDADMAALEAQVKTLVSEAVSAIPAPKDGVDGRDGRDGVDGKDGEDGKDGKSFTLKDADELLQEKMARWELDFERRATAALEKAIDRMPKPKDGVDGKDGADGLGFDDMQVEYDGERGVTLKFARGDRVKSVSLRIPVVIDRGVYRANESYEPGDGVTWGGSYWIAQQETKAKPDTPNSGWRLAVKKGRDGKDGRDGIDKTAAVKVKS